MGMFDKINMEAASGFLNSDENKGRVSRFLVIVAAMIIFATVVIEVIKTAGLVGIVIGGVFLTFSSFVPRPILLWWQRQSALVELTMGIALGTFGGASAGSWSSMTFMAVALFITSAIKLLNMAHAFSYGDSLYEHLCKSNKKIWREIGLWWFFGSAKGPLDPLWKWDSDKVGPLGWKFLLYSTIALLQKDYDYDFFAGVGVNKPWKMWRYLRPKRYYFDLENWTEARNKAKYLADLKAELSVLRLEFNRLSEKPVSPDEPGAEAYWAAINPIVARTMAIKKELEA